MFNMQTATLLVGLLYVVMPLFTWIVLGESRNHAATLWCLGGLGMGVAAVMVSTFSAGGSATLSLSLPILLNTISLAMRVQALRIDLELPALWRRFVLVILSSTLLFEYLHRGLGLYVPRALYGSLVFVVGGALIVQHAVRISKNEKSTMARWIAWAYGGVTLAFIFRMVYLLRLDFSLVKGNITTEGPASIVAALVLLLSSVIGHIGYVGLFLERAQRRAVSYADEQARLEVSQQLGAQIAVLERRQSLGELAASIGHELNQPLTAILTNAQLAKRGLHSGRLDAESAQQLLGKIEFNTQRASKILERIRNFMRTPAVQRDKVDLHEISNDVLELLEGELRKHDVRIEVGVIRGPEWVNADPLAISQVLLNLLRNAIDSMQTMPEKRIRITIERNGNRVLLQVRDWGTGIDEETLARLGTPFFSTKAQGLGMGLTISRNIARDHGGTLSLSGAHNGPGTLAVLDLPALHEVTTP